MGHFGLGKRRTPASPARASTLNSPLMRNGDGMAKTITVYGISARLIDELAQDYPTHTAHRIAAAALRVGLEAVKADPTRLTEELVAMARQAGESTTREAT